MANEEIKSHGVSSTTPEQILLGAGTMHAGLVFATGAWNFAESLIGPTSGGNKLSIVPDLTDVPIDGINVKTKGLTLKVGESAKFETNFAVLNSDIMKMTTLGTKSATSSVLGFNEIISKGGIDEGDYIDKLGYIGQTIAGKPIIIIFDNALCTSGFELDGKNKEGSVFKATFECYAGMTGDGQTLPYHIFYPTELEVA